MPLREERNIYGDKKEYQKKQKREGPCIIKGSQGHHVCCLFHLCGKPYFPFHLDVS